MDNNYFAKLNSINVGEHLEKKGQFTYLSWPFAVKELRQADPAATWEVKRFDGLPFLKTELGFFVEVAVSVQGITLSQIHPVLDARNDPIEKPNSFDINTSIQRALTKAIALHGLGLGVYQGEDLPVTDQQRQEPAAQPKAPVSQHPTSTPASPAQIRFIEALIAETSGDLSKVLAHYRVNALSELSSNAASRAITSLQAQRRAA